MYGELSSDIMASAIEMLCYVFTVGAALFSYLFTLR